MSIRRYILRTYFYIRYGFHKITRTGSFDGSAGSYIEGPIPSEGNPLKKALLKHHIKQFHGASCSVASVVNVVNAIRELQLDRPVPITQMDILEKVRTAHWKERMMSPKGYKGRKGLPLSVLYDVVKASLDVYELRYQTVEAVQARKDANGSKSIKRALRRRLNDFEKNGDCLIIAHFDQGTFIPTLNIPHISPVGGFDVDTGDVIILDVDPEQEKPYRITFDTFYKGISDNYNYMFRKFGFKSGGYIYIKLPS